MNTQQLPQLSIGEALKAACPTLNRQLQNY